MCPFGYSTQTFYAQPHLNEPPFHTSFIQPPSLTLHFHVRHPLLPHRVSRTKRSFPSCPPMKFGPIRKGSSSSKSQGGVYTSIIQSLFCFVLYLCTPRIDSGNRTNVYFVKKRNKKPKMESLVLSPHHQMETQCLT